MVAFAMPPPSRVSRVACARRAPTVSSREVGHGRRVLIKSQLKVSSMSPAKKVSNLSLSGYLTLNREQEPRRHFESLFGPLERARRRTGAF